MPRKTWPSWLFGSTVGASRRTLPSTSPAPRILIRAAWLTWSFAISRVGTMPTRSNSLRAMIENSASPLPEASAPIDRGGVRDRAGDRSLHLHAAAFRQVQPRQHLPGRDGFAGIDQHFRNLQPEALRPHRGLFPRHQDAGHLDVVAEAEFRGLQHGDRRPLGRRLGFLGVGSRGDQAQHSGRHQDGPFRLYGARGLLVHGPSISN